jgi:glycosyltransferase involved in cell wall biosynthesis
VETKNKKILFVINKLGVGGAERVFVNDVNSLHDLGYDVRIVTLFGGVEDQSLLKDLRLPNDRVHHLNSGGVFDPSVIYGLAKIVRKNKIDIVYSTLNESNIVTRVVKIFSPQTKVFIREANVAEPKPFSFKVLDIILNIFASRIVCVSEEVRQSLKKYLPMYVSKMTVLMNGVDLPSGQKIYSESTNGVKILNVGSLNPKKGQRYLIDASAILRDRGSNFELHIYGRGREQQNLEALINSLNLDKFVFLHEPVTYQELSQKYFDADIFVLSSLWEGCPNVLLEAMAHGTASVTTLVSGAKDIVENGKCGMFANVGDAISLAQKIEILINDHELRKKIGIAGKQCICQNYSVDQHVKRLLLIFEEYGI